MTAVDPAEDRVDGLPTGDDRSDEELGPAHVADRLVHLLRRLLERSAAARAAAAPPARCLPARRRSRPFPPRRRSRARRRRGSRRSRTSRRRPRSSAARCRRAHRRRCGRSAAEAGSAGARQRASSPFGGAPRRPRRCSRPPSSIAAAPCRPSSTSGLGRRPSARSRPIARPRSHIGAMVTPGSSDSRLSGESGDAVLGQLGPERQRRVEPLRVLLGPGQAQQVGAVDVDHVQRHRVAADPARLGHELLREQVGRNLVQDARDVERDRGAGRAGRVPAALELPFLLGAHVREDAEDPYTDGPAARRRGRASTWVHAIVPPLPRGPRTARCGSLVRMVAARGSASAGAGEPSS